MSTSKNIGVNITPEKEAKLHKLVMKNLIKNLAEDWTDEILDHISEHIKPATGIKPGYEISALGEEAIEEFLTKELTSIFEAIDDISIRTD